MNGATVYNGVGVDLAGCRIEFAHRAIKFAPRETLLIGLLARAMPTPVTHNFLRDRVWAKTHKPSDAAAILNDMARACAPSLASIGLEIKITKGVGIGLRVAQ
jgi:DNA-binding response OmpR family regulator